MSERLRRRAAQVEGRLAVRAWKFRQRHHAGGVWFALRRVLADAAEAWIIPEEQAAVLVGEGVRPEAVGAALEPPRVILFVPRERLERIAGRRGVALHLSPELLAAKALALVRFD
ncbi:MAG TPA: hypothetical protein VG389_20385 [Myxococcota bacterium]|nr:hypothetical protein [Myxococcota bacterium]